MIHSGTTARRQGKTCQMDAEPATVRRAVCIHCGSTHHRIENCHEVVAAFGPPRRTCRKCMADALPRHSLCALHLAEHSTPALSAASRRYREYKRYQKRKAKR